MDWRPVPVTADVSVAETHICVCGLCGSQTELGHWNLCCSSSWKTHQSPVPFWTCSFAGWGFQGLVDNHILVPEHSCQCDFLPCWVAAKVTNQIGGHTESQWSGCIPIAVAATLVYTPEPCAKWKITCCEKDLSLEVLPDVPELCSQCGWFCL